MNLNVIMYELAILRYIQVNFEEWLVVDDEIAIYFEICSCME
jgi:hypothetical protein